MSANRQVHIAATVAFSCRTDSNTPGEYTRAALDIKVRPDHRQYKIDPKIGKESYHPATASIFTAHDHLPEHQLRPDSQKWCTMMHTEKNKRTSGLDGPVFDIHYVDRAPG